MRRSGPVGDGDRPLPGWLRAILCFQALTLLSLGAALFAAPVGASSLWPWALTPLTGRAIGAFLVGFGVAAAFAVLENDVRRLHGAALAYATLGALRSTARTSRPPPSGSPSTSPSPSRCSGSASTARS
jgi:hypothetical protein